MFKKNRLVCFATLAILLPIQLSAQVLETEESKPLLPKQFAFGASIEYQKSKEGYETAIPLAIEYGISKKFTLLIEPVIFTNIASKNTPNANGIGDLEVTLFYQIVSEKRIMPSISISAEVKLPTARNSLIGTGKSDFTPFLIFSKTKGRFFTSLNLSYTFLGKPSGVVASNLFNYAMGTTYTISPRSILFAEFYGNTAAIDAVETVIGSTPNTKTLEISGGENVGALGYGFYLKKDLILSFGINYDNNNAILFRPGIEWKFGGKH